MPLSTSNTDADVHEHLQFTSPNLLTDDSTILTTVSLNPALTGLTSIGVSGDITLAAGSSYKIGTDAIATTDTLYTQGANITIDSTNSNAVNLKTTITATTLGDTCSWSGNQIGSAKIADGSVSNTEFQRLGSLTSAILETNMKDASNGVAGLDGNGLIPTNILPSSIDDIRNFTNLAAFPQIAGSPPPEKGIIYVALDTNKSYRWNGATSGANSVVYTEITNGLVIGTTAGTAGSGLLLHAVRTSNVDGLPTKQDNLTFGKSNTNTLKLEQDVETDDILLMGGTNVKGRTYSQLKNDLTLNLVENIAVSSLGGTNITYSNSQLNLDNTINNLTRLCVGSSRNDATTGLETYGKVIASRIDFDGIRDLLYLNNAGDSASAETGMYFRQHTYNMMIRWDGVNLKFGTATSANQAITEFMRINATELKVSGDCNLTSTHKYKINDLQIDSEDVLYLSSGTDTIKTKIDSKQDTITDGANLSFNGDTLNLDSALTNIASMDVTGIIQCDRLDVRKDSVSGVIQRDHIYINNDTTSGGLEGDAGIIFRNHTRNFVTRWEKSGQFAMGSSNAIINGAISPFFVIDSVDRKVSINNGTGVYRFLFDTVTGTQKIVFLFESGTSFRAILDFYSLTNGQESSRGQIRYNGSVVQYLGTSDIRTKEDIKPINNHFEVLDKLNPVNFRLKENGNLCDGFIADEVYEIYPIATSGVPGAMNEDGSPDYMMLDTKPFIPILTQCIKGNRGKIQDLETQNEKLQSEIDLLKSDLDAIKQHLNI